MYKISIFTYSFSAEYIRLDTNTLLAQTLLVQHVVGLIKDQNLEFARIE